MNSSDANAYPSESSALPVGSAPHAGNLARLLWQ